MCCELGLHRFIMKNRDAISTYIAILGLIGLVLVYFQLHEFLDRADLHIEFSGPESPQYRITNASNVIAEEPYYQFSIFNIEDISPTMRSLRIPGPKEISFIKGFQSKGPWNLLDNGIQTKEYFGYAFVDCRNCEEKKVYWVHLRDGSPDDFWYVEGKSKDVWDFSMLLREPRIYLDSNFPLEKRVQIQRENW